MSESIILLNKNNGKNLIHEIELKVICKGDQKDMKMVI